MNYTLFGSILLCSLFWFDNLVRFVCGIYVDTVYVLLFSVREMNSPEMEDGGDVLVETRDEGRHPLDEGHNLEQFSHHVKVRTWMRI